MPRAIADGVELYFESLGEGTPIIFQAHDHTPWLFFQAPVFSQRYRVVTYDRRSKRQPRSDDGESEGPPTTDPAFAASPLGRMVASTGTGLGRTPGDIARAIAVLRDWDQRPAKPELARLRVPTLVIVGEREPRLTIDGAREWASWIPGAEFAILPGAHHAAPREAAAAWNATVLGFLDRSGL